MYDPFHLRGTYVRTIHNNKVTDVNGYLTYDMVYKKYYLLFTAISH